MQIWYAMNTPNATLIRPDAMAKFRLNRRNRLPAYRKVDAMLRVISIMPKMVPTPKMTRYAIAHAGFLMLASINSAIAADPARP